MADQQEGDPQTIAENPFRLVVVAASAGGIAALTGGFPAAVAIVQHRTVIAQDQATSELFDICERLSAQGWLISSFRSQASPRNCFHWWESKILSSEIILRRKGELNPIGMPFLGGS